MYLTNLLNSLTPGTESKPNNGRGRACRLKGIEYADNNGIYGTYNAP